MSTIKGITTTSSTPENPTPNKIIENNKLDSKVMAVCVVALLGFVALVMKLKGRKIIETVSLQFPIQNPITSKAGTCAATKIARHNGSAVYTVKVNTSGTSFEKHLDRFLNQWKYNEPVSEVEKSDVNEKVLDKKDVNEKVSDKKDENLNESEVKKN